MNRMAASNTILVWGATICRCPQTWSQYQTKSSELLTAVRTVSETFRRLVVCGEQQLIAVPDDLTRLWASIESELSRDNYTNDYLNRVDGTLGPETLCRTGFAVSYCTPSEDMKSVVPPEQGGMTLRLRGCAASQEPSGDVVLKLSVREDLTDPRMLRQFLNILVNVWGCSVGGVSSRSYEQTIKETNRASYAGQWLFYLPFPHLAKCLPADIRHEPFANGILIETTPHMPDANNPADVAAGMRVRDVLDELGLVNDATYAIEGWPPDREESLYEQFISGAPPDRKYTVHCVNFDGYDPDRKALLYAKLFRRLRRHPKEWGFRGWDGPVLNEAKRQVRAAAKAGGVPIEWHIGLEEPAHQVRQLLADHTDITEQQLRVIFTPLEEALSSLPP